MKKLFAIAVLASMTFCVSAQNEVKKFRFGPTAGLNISTMSPVDADHSSKIGFNVGALAEYNFTDNIFMTGALKFSQKGITWNNFASNGADVKANPSYIEIPIHVGYRYGLSDKFSLFADFGPYFAVGICGKLKANGYDSSNYFGDESVAFFGGEAKRFDFGLGFAVGAEYSNIQLRAGCDFGLIKGFDVSVLGKTVAKTRNIYVSVGYMF